MTDQPFVLLILVIAILATGLFAWRQIIDLQASLALRRPRRVLHFFLRTVIADKDESEAVRLMAYWLFRTSLNERLLRRLADAQHRKLLRRGKVQRPKARKHETEELLDTCVRLLAMMSLVYHPEHGAAFRGFMSNLDDLDDLVDTAASRASVLEGQLKEVRAIRPPKVLRVEAGMVEEVIEADGCFA